MHVKRRNTLPAAVGTVFALTLLSLLAAAPSFGQQKPQADHSEKAGVPVTVARAETRDLPIYTTGIGTVQAWRAVQIRAQVTGYVQTINFREGQEVKPGDLLATIDPRPYAAALAQAQAKKAGDVAKLANAQVDLQRDSRSRNRTSPRASRSIRHRPGAAVPGQYAGGRRGDRDGEAQPGVLPHHLADRRRGRAAAGRSRQPDPCQRHAGDRHHQQQSPDRGDLHAAAGRAAAVHAAMAPASRWCWPSPPTHHAARRRHAADDGQQHRPDHRHDQLKAVFPNEDRSCGPASSSTRICSCASTTTR